jgi:hypothetical protein
MLVVLAVPLLALVLSTPPGDLVAGLRHPLALIRTPPQPVDHHV